MVQSEINNVTSNVTCWIQTNDVTRKRATVSVVVVEVSDIPIDDKDAVENAVVETMKNTKVEVKSTVLDEVYIINTPCTDKGIYIYIYIYI